MRSSTPALPALAELAGRYGVQASFVGTDGRVHRAEDAVIVAILARPRGSARLGVRCRRRPGRAPAGRGGALALEPVLVHRVGGPPGPR